MMSSFVSAERISGMDRDGERISMDDGRGVEAIAPSPVRCRYQRL